MIDTEHPPEILTSLEALLHTMRDPDLLTECPLPENLVSHFASRLRMISDAKLLYIALLAIENLEGGEL